MNLRNSDGIAWRAEDAMGLAGMGGAHPWASGIQRVSRDRGEWRNGVAGPDTLTFSAFFAASASERLSKLTKPTGCGGRTGVISQGSREGSPSPQGMVRWLHAVWSSSYLLGGEFDERPFVPLQGKD